MSQSEQSSPTLHHHHSVINNYKHVHDHPGTDHNDEQRHDDNQTPDDLYYGSAHYH